MRCASRRYYLPISIGLFISGECDHRILRTFIEDDLMGQRHGANALLISAIADAAETARHLGEALAAGEGSDQDDTRIYSAIIEAVRTTVTWLDPDSEGKIVNPQHIGRGALTWETLPAHASWAAYNRASSDPHRLAD